jgi:HSP20 family protein
LTSLHIPATAGENINLRIGEQDMLPARRFNLPDIFNDFFDNGGIERINTKTPAINVIEGENTYKIEVATPGMTKDDFKVHVNKDGNLVIEMEKKEKEKEECKKECKYIRREFAYTRFHQTLILPENADKDKIEAKVENGVLKIRIPKLQMVAPENEKKLIEVK